MYRQCLWDLEEVKHNLVLFTDNYPHPMYRKIFLSSYFLLFVLFANAHLSPNETLVYNGSYQLSGLLTNFAQLTMRSETMQTSKKSYLHLSFEVSTFNKWDSYFKIRDLYESYVEPTNYQPSLYKRNVYEGGYTKTEKYTFKPNGTITSTSKRTTKPEQTKTITIGSKTVDVVSLIYKIRLVDFSKVKVGQALPFTLVFDEKEYQVLIKLLGTETVSAGNLGKKECYKLAIAAKTDKLKGVNKNLIWISTDKSRIPCQIKFQIPVGVGQLTLAKATL